jgi:dephospho-CoA kinase
MRNDKMSAVANNPAVVAYIWDTPLLVEAGLDRQCDAVVFVDAREKERQRRVRETRGWSTAEWARRENLQLPLDKKRIIANYMVSNTADADEGVRDQVREVLSRILADVQR